MHSKINNNGPQLSELHLIRQKREKKQAISYSSAFLLLPCPPCFRFSSSGPILFAVAFSLTLELSVIHHSFTFFYVGFSSCAPLTWRIELKIKKERRLERTLPRTLEINTNNFIANEGSARGGSTEFDTGPSRHRPSAAAAMTMFGKEMRAAAWSRHPRCPLCVQAS